MGFSPEEQGWFNIGKTNVIHCLANWKKESWAIQMQENACVKT